MHTKYIFSIGGLPRLSLVGKQMPTERLADLICSSAQAGSLQFGLSIWRQQLSQQLLSHAGRLATPSCRPGPARRMTGLHTVGRAVLRGQPVLLCVQQGSRG